MEPMTPRTQNRVASEIGVELSNVLGELGDSLTSLILSSLTEKFNEVQSSCLALASQTNTLVAIVQKLAVASGDEEYQTAATQVIRELSASVTDLVSAFTSFIKNPTAAASKRAFADAAQKVGLTIDTLLLTVDQSASRRIIALVKDALVASKAIGESALSSSGNTLQLARIAAEKNAYLSDMVWQVGAGTPDTEKRNLLLQGLSQLKEASSQLDRASEIVSKNPDDSDPLVDATNALAAAYRVFLQAANIRRSSYLSDTWDRVEHGANQIYESLRVGDNLLAHTRQLYASALHGSDDFNELAKKVAGMALELMKQGNAIIEKSQDPVARYAIEEALNRIRGLCTEFINKAQALQKNPNDERLRQELHIKVQEMELAMDQLKSAITMASTSVPPDAKISLTTHYIADQAHRLANAGGNAQVRDKAASQLQALTNQLVVDADAISQQPGNSASQGQIKSIAGDIKKSADLMVTAAKAGQPTQTAHTQLVGKIQELHTACNLPPFRGPTPAAPAVSAPPTRVATGEEGELIAAAREQAEVALNLARQVEAASSNPQTAQAIAQLRQAAQRVIQAAHAAASRPGDAEAQRELADAQRQLAVAIRAVVDSHERSRGNQAVKEAMAGMDQASSAGPAGTAGAKNVLNSAHGTISSIDKALANSRPSPEEALTSSKDVSEQARQLSKLLREMAEATDNPQIKAQLIEYAKIVNDRSVQVKILTAVTAASGNVKTDQVRQALEGLRRSVKEVIDVLCAASLKQQLKNTQLQTEAIKKVLAALQRT